MFIVVGFSRSKFIFYSKAFVDMPGKVFKYFFDSLYECLFKLLLNMLLCVIYWCFGIFRQRRCRQIVPDCQVSTILCVRVCQRACVYGTSVVVHVLDGVVGVVVRCWPSHQNQWWRPAPRSLCLAAQANCI